MKLVMAFWVGVVLVALKVSHVLLTLPTMPDQYWLAITLSTVLVLLPGSMALRAASSVWPIRRKMLAQTWRGRANVPYFRPSVETVTERRHWLANAGFLGFNLGLSLLFGIYVVSLIRDMGVALPLLNLGNMLEPLAMLALLATGFTAVMWRIHGPRPDF